MAIRLPNLRSLWRRSAPAAVVPPSQEPAAEPFGLEQPIHVPMSGVGSNSVGADKAMVYDEDKGLFLLMSRDVAKVKVMRDKPRGWKIATSKALAIVGGASIVLGTPVVLAWKLGFGPFHRPAAPAAALATAAPAELPAVPASAAAPEPQVRKPAPAPVQPPKAVPVAPAVAAAKALPGPAPAQTPSAQPTAAAPRPVATTPRPVVADSAGKGWALRVVDEGVIYFDGQTTKVYRVGSTLPTGEKVIMVDEGSATYATDKGVRQIRSTQLN